MAEPTSMTPGAPIVVTLSTSNAATASAFGTANSGQPTATTVVRMCATVDTWVTVGVTPVSVAATAGAFLLPANSVEYIDVPFGHKVAGIAGGAGYLSLTPMTKG